MEMRKQGGSEGQGTARSASKTPGGRKQTDEQAPNSTNQAASRNQGTTQQTGGEQDLLQHAKQATGEIVNKVQQQAGSQLNQQKETAASQLSQVANAVRRIRENIPEQEGGPIGRFVGDYGEKAANSIDRLSTYIREQDPKRLLNDVQNFGRRQPVLLIGGAFLLGFAGARFIRSSMGTEYQQRSGQANVQGTSFTPKRVSSARQSTNPGAV